MIWDVVLVGYETDLDLLELRIDERRRSGVVARTVAIESAVTFQGKEKPLYLHRELTRFESLYRSGELLYKRAQLPAEGTGWDRERVQRDSGLWTVESLGGYDDLVLISDVDEIPDPTQWRVLDHVQQDRAQDWKWPLLLTHRQTYFYLDCLSDELCDCGRVAPLSLVRSQFGGSLQDLRYAKPTEGIAGGWHFSWLGGADAVRRKLAAFSHDEWNRGDILDRVGDALRDGFALNDPSRRYRFAPLDETWPADVLERWQWWAERGYIHGAEQSNG